MIARDLHMLPINGVTSSEGLNVWYGFVQHNEINIEAIHGYDIRKIVNVNLDKGEALRLAEALLRAVRELDNMEGLK